jgi:hypothetical protein
VWPEISVGLKKCISEVIAAHEPRRYNYWKPLSDRSRLVVEIVSCFGVVYVSTETQHLIGHGSEWLTEEVYKTNRISTFQ